MSFNVSYIGGDEVIQTFVGSMLSYCILLTPCYIVLRFLWMRHRPKILFRELLMYVFFLYCVSIFSQTIIPHFSIIKGDVDFYFDHSFVSSNLTPFATISLYVHQLDGPLRHIAFYNLAGNIILFIPFGLLMPLIWRKLRTFWGMCVLAITIPVFIEGTQYFIGRSVDIDDVILNAIAIIFGYFVYAVIGEIVKIVEMK